LIDRRFIENSFANSSLPALVGLSRKHTVMLGLVELVINSIGKCSLGLLFQVVLIAEDKTAMQRLRASLHRDGYLERNEPVVQPAAKGRWFVVGFVFGKGRARRGKG
jgi:hypothetical protein